jgi:putative spermidine/putrescine transport system permease protein
LEASAAVAGRPRPGAARRVQIALYRRPWLRGSLLLSGPLGWMLLIYIAALVVLFLSAFWTVDPFTGKVVHHWGLQNFKTLVQDHTYRTIALRTIGIAAAVTLTDAVLAFPFAYFAARLASRRMQTVLFVLVLLPLWSSYLARVYAWRLILSKDGALNWATDKLHIGSLNLGYSNTAMWIVFSYIWLPFMITPVWAAIERVPDSLLEASSDLGAKRFTTFRRVLLPLAWPGVIAGSIFTFSLTLGDYITPTLVGGASSDFIGNVVYSNVGVANNVPFAAAFATVPVVIMGVYLVVARRAGATDAL